MSRRKWRLVGLMLAVGLSAGVVACQKPDLQGPVLGASDLNTATPAVFEEPTASAIDPSKPRSPGLSDEVMRLGVIADITNSKAVTKGSEAAWLAMRAWARSINDRGGLGGRDVEVVLFDANVFRHAEVMREACESDIFALVGSYALQDGEGVDYLNEESCQLPDFPAAALSPKRRESPVTFVSNPVSNTVWQAGPAQYLSERFSELTDAVATVVLDMPVAFYQAQREIEAATGAGFRYVHQATADVVGQDYDALALELLRSGARSVTWTADSERMLELLQAWTRLVDASATNNQLNAADLAAIRRVNNELSSGQFFFYCGADCYSQTWPERAGELNQNVWVSINMLPFEEPGDNVELVRYVLSLREQVDEEAELDLIGLSSWASALLFEEAVNKARFLSGGGLTRELVIEAASTITEWNGRGLHGYTNPAEGHPSSCFMLVTPTTSGWIRRHPAAPGTMDCDPDNLVELVESAGLGTEIADILETRDVGASVNPRATVAGTAVTYQ